MKLAVEASRFVGPAFLDLILHASDKNEPTWKGYLYASAMLAGLLIGTFASHRQYQLSMRAGFRMRSIITTEVQRKMLYLTPTDRAKFSSGQIFNFVASDAEMLQTVSQELLGLIAFPLRIIAATLLLARQLGFASLVALVVLSLMVPVQTRVVRWSAKFKKEALKETDERTRVETEIISGESESSPVLQARASSHLGIEAVKCNAWEQPFWKRILEVRGRELSVLWRSFILGALLTAWY